MRKTICWLIAIFFVLPSLAGSQALKDDPRVKSALHLLELWLDAQVAYDEIPGLGDDLGAGICSLAKRW